MSPVLNGLILAGILGMIGQGARAIVGLKGLADQNGDPAATTIESFSTARLCVSLVIGFVAGSLAGLGLGLTDASLAAGDRGTLLGLIAAGYAGTDFIEGFMAKYLPAGAAVAKAPVAPAPPLAMALIQPHAVTAAAGDQRVRAACEAEWDANKGDCSAFVRAVGTQLGVAIQGNADAIVHALRSGGHWEPIADGPAAAAAARNGRFVVCGLLGSEQAVPDVHGHVVVIVDGTLNRGAYPHAYWGRYGGVGAKDQTINWAWTAADRDRVTYAAYEP